MIPLVAALWPGLAGAAALGIAVGMIAGWPSRPAIPAALCGATVLLSAVTGLAQGIPALWLENAALVLPSYVVGCAAGALLRRLFLRG